MEITAGPLDWTTNDEENLARFLDTETGKRFLPKLLESVPALLAHGDIHSILIRSGEVRGFQEIARTILALAHPIKSDSENKSEYPNLEDDRAWADGHKLNSPTQ